MSTLRDAYDFIFKSYPTLNRRVLALNAFFNQPLFASNNLAAQAADISDNLGVTTVRILFHWHTTSESDPLYFKFIDDILTALPKNINALMIIGGAPQWLTSKPLATRRALYTKTACAVIDRYKAHPRVVAFQIHNEPNTTMFQENSILEFVNDPLGYLAVLRDVYAYAKKVAKNKLIVSASTTSVLQNYPTTLKYLRTMLANGLEASCDVVGIHHYGTSAWSMCAPNGVLDTLRSITKPIWITELGTTKVNQHTKYLLKYAGFITEKVPSVEKVFWYHYDGDTADKFTLRDSSGIVSPLYDFLKNNK